MQKIKSQAKTIEKALNEAASQLGTDVDSLEYKIISQTDGGFLSFLGSKRVEIEAWVKSGASSHKRSAPKKMAADDCCDHEHDSHSEDSVSAEPLSAEETKSLVEDLRAFCAGICERVSQQPVAVHADINDGRLVLNIEDEFMASQIGKNSKIAESLEHLLRKKPRYLKRELPFRIFIDVNGVRMNREQELIEMAKDLSLKVHENQKPVVLNYKSSYDRKIIHMALDRDERVYTKSIGSGTNRKLMILPIKNDQESANR
jgi:spoIIIJ-associated protein